MPRHTSETGEHQRQKEDFKSSQRWAAWVAQQFSATFSPGRDPGDLGSSPTSAPAWSLLLPLPVSLPFSLSLSLSLSVSHK